MIEFSVSIIFLALPYLHLILSQNILRMKRVPNQRMVKMTWRLMLIVWSTIKTCA